MSRPGHHGQYMKRAIELARRNPNAPFGALLVDRRTGEVVAEGWNRGSKNPILHGEIDTILRAGAGDPEWPELVLYTTAEPCPMCQSAICWAGVPEVVYGTSIDTLKRLGWQQIDIPSQEVAKRTPFMDCSITGGILEEECDSLFSR